MLVPAHGGHWVESLVFAAPVLIGVGVMLVDRVRQRRRGRDDAR